MSEINWPKAEMLVRVFFTGKQRMERAEFDRPGIKWARYDEPIEMMSEALQQLALLGDRLDGIDATAIMHVGGGFLTATLAEQDRAWAQVKLIQGRCEAKIGSDPLWGLILGMERTLGFLEMVNHSLRTDGGMDDNIYFDRMTTTEAGEAKQTRAMPTIRKAADSALATMRDVMRPHLLPPDSPVIQVLDRRNDDSLETLLEVARAWGMAYVPETTSNVLATLAVVVDVTETIVNKLATFERPYQKGAEPVSGEAYPRAFYKSQGVTDAAIDGAVRQGKVHPIGPRPKAYPFAECKAVWPWLQSRAESQKK